MKLQKFLDERQELTELLGQYPHDPRILLQRSRCYVSLEYPELAAGDAYKALLLIDDARTTCDSGDYSVQAREALAREANQPVLRGDGVPFSLSADDAGTDRDLDLLAIACYQVLAQSLLSCGCLQSALDFCRQGLRLQPNPALEETKANILNGRDASQSAPQLPDKGNVRREVYPWNDHEPDRYGPSHLDRLNKRLATVAPKLCVKATDLPVLSRGDAATGPSTSRQLGLFAGDDIAPGETILCENSVLTANNRASGELCDACSGALPDGGPTPDGHGAPPACEDCPEIVFCSTACRDAALSGYHRPICGLVEDLETIGKNVQGKEAVDALYLLLVGRAFALAEARQVHPLELEETKFLWGEFALPRPDPPPPPPSPTSSGEDTQESSPHSLPFSFKYSVVEPLRILEAMQIDPFESAGRHDFWVINTLFAKFRGVASGRLDPRTGWPEVCAVHPLWCLANHSCAPNVRWEWAAEICFWARSGDEIVRWGDGANNGLPEGGIRKGEEILNHYCDVRLSVDQRREWAMGALGGVCMCARCIWEKSHSDDVA